MFEFLKSLTITEIIAFMALLSPVITAAINNFYAYRIKKLEIKENQRTQEIVYQKRILEDYCNSLSSTIGYTTNDNFNNYCSNYGKAILYMTDEQSKVASKIFDLLINNKNDQAEPLCTEHLLKIKCDLKKLDK